MTVGRLVWISGRGAVPNQDQILGIVVLEREVQYLGSCVAIAIEQPPTIDEDQLQDLIAHQMHSNFHKVPGVSLYTDRNQFGAVVANPGSHLDPTVKPLSVLEELAIDLEEPRQFYLFARFDRRFRQHDRVDLVIPFPNRDGIGVSERNLERAAVGLRRTLYRSLPKAWVLDIITWENTTIDRHLVSPPYSPTRINVLRHDTTRLTSMDLLQGPLVSGVPSVRG